MQLTVTGKQINVGDALRDHVFEELDRGVSKYFDDAIDAHVAFGRDAHLFRCDISVHARRGVMMKASGASDEIYVAFDQALSRAEKQLRRYKRRLRDHHRTDARADAAQNSFASIPARAYVLAAEEDETVEREDVGDGHPVVIAETDTAILSLTVGEAVMRMDLADQAALLFRNKAHGGLNLVYRREDGNIGWVDPRQPA